MKTTTIFLLLLASAFRLHSQTDEFELEKQISKVDYYVDSKIPASGLCSLMKKKTILSMGVFIEDDDHLLRKIRLELAPCFDHYKITRCIKFCGIHPCKDLLELKRYPNIELLETECNFNVFTIKDKGRYFRRGIKGLNKLKIFKIGWLLDNFPESLYAQKNLISLLIGFEAKSLSKPLNLPSLVCLQMYCPNLRKIPDGIANSPDLTTIEIVNNRLLHSLPGEICDLKRLERMTANVDTDNMENINILNQINHPFFLRSYVDDIEQISSKIQYLHSNIAWEFIIRQKETPELLEKTKTLKKLCPNIDIVFNLVPPAEYQFERFL